VRIGNGIIRRSVNLADGYVALQYRRDATCGIRRIAAKQYATALY
jgi:hypothetical protein